MCDLLHPAYTIASIYDIIAYMKHSLASIFLLNPLIFYLFIISLFQANRKSVFLNLQIFSTFAKIVSSVAQDTDADEEVGFP